MTLIEFKSKFMRIAKPLSSGNWRVFDFEKGKQVLKRANGRDRAPTVGYVVDCCTTYNNYESIYLVGDKSMHESCAMKQFGYAEERIK
jgi:hypothetical protein